MKKPPLSTEQQARLDAELAKQKATRERIQDLATNSIMAWVTKVITPLVRNAVRSVMDWISRLFKR